MTAFAGMRRGSTHSSRHHLRRTTFEWLVEHDVHRANWPLSTPHRYLTCLFHASDKWLGHLRDTHHNLTRQSVEELASAVHDCAAWNMSKKPAWSFSRIVAFALIRHWNNH